MNLIHDFSLNENKQVTSAIMEYVLYTAFSLMPFTYCSLSDSLERVEH